MWVTSRLGPYVCLSVIQCSGSQIVCCMDLKLGMVIDLDDILDKYYDQGHGLKVKVEMLKKSVKT